MKDVERLEVERLVDEALREAAKARFWARVSLTIAFVASAFLLFGCASGRPVVVPDIETITVEVPVIVIPPEVEVMPWPELLTPTWSSGDVRELFRAIATDYATLLGWVERARNQQLALEAGRREALEAAGDAP
jgi:hypothetical protein